MKIHHLKPAYVNVAYCIDTPTYHKPEANEIGFMSEEDRTAFFADCKRVFQNGGWEIEHDYAVNGKSRLYLHPQQFSGIVHTELLHVVPELIAGAALFQLQSNGVRVMESVYDITEEQQWEYLATRRPEIEAELLAVFRTSQRKVFRNPRTLLWSDIELPTGRKYGLPALDEQVNNATGRYVDEVFRSLITTGRIIQKTINGNVVYRTAMKSDRPSSKKKQTDTFPDTPELFSNMERIDHYE